LKAEVVAYDQTKDIPPPTNPPMNREYRRYRRRDRGDSSKPNSRASSRSRGEKDRERLDQYIREENMNLNETKRMLRSTSPTRYLTVGTVSPYVPNGGEMNEARVSPTRPSPNTNHNTNLPSNSSRYTPPTYPLTTTTTGSGILRVVSSSSLHDSDKNHNSERRNKRLNRRP
jgi:hypothetical protein